MPQTIATIIAVSTEAMILLPSKDDIGVLFASSPGCAGRAAGGRKSDSHRQLNPIIALPASKRTGHLVAAGLSNDPHVNEVSAARPIANPIIMIPARLAATRLPNKPLAEIAGAPMIVHVWRRAVAAGSGPVVVACGDKEIAARIEREGGRAVLTDPALPTGSDRIHAALAALDPGGAHDAVVNVQGDMPMLDPAAIRIALDTLAETDADIATLAAEITDPAALHEASVNKVVAGFADPARPARALYFSKAAVPWGEGPHYEHIGLYAYRRAALDRFVRLPRGILEQRERLEQLRALEAGMHIAVSLIDPAQLGIQVDTPADLARARALMGHASA
jgi:3-deoxy-manno-octulosonate cytidylyltransferase (CMP-KDO synthetase)